MGLSSTIVDFPGCELLVCQAKSFPDGIREAWQTLEGRLGSRRGRKFYGVTEPGERGLVYFAGVEPLDQGEVDSLGFPVHRIEAGRFARVKLLDWPTRIDQIPRIFEELFETHTPHPSHRALEYYRSQKELHLMMQLPEGN